MERVYNMLSPNPVHCCRIYFHDPLLPKKPPELSGLSNHLSLPLTILWVTGPSWALLLLVISPGAAVIWGFERATTSKMAHLLAGSRCWLSVRQAPGFLFMWHRPVAGASHSKMSGL